MAERLRRLDVFLTRDRPSPGAESTGRNPDPGNVSPNRARECASRMSVADDCATCARVFVCRAEGWRAIDHAATRSSKPSGGGTPSLRKDPNQARAKHALRPQRVSVQGSLDSSQQVALTLWTLRDGADRRHDAAAGICRSTTLTVRNAAKHHQTRAVASSVAIVAAGPDARPGIPHHRLHAASHPVETERPSAADLTRSPLQCGSDEPNMAPSTAGPAARSSRCLSLLWCLS